MMSHQGTLSSPQPPCQIIMPYFSHYKKNGVIWSSLPFHSSQGGYRMCLRVAANGVTTGTGTHVSVLVCLLEGENDEQLKMPFGWTVVFAVVNWRNDENHIVRPVSFKNTFAKGHSSTSSATHPLPKGYVELLPHSALGYNAVENTQYVLEDCLCLRVLSITIPD